MTKHIQIKKGIDKSLKGTFTWWCPVWTTKAGLFANCVIKSPPEKTFDSHEEALYNLDETLWKLGLGKKPKQPKKAKKI